MYRYDPVDQKILDERVAQFRDQMDRYLNGEIPDQEFLPLRLQNGLYVQRLAPMLRVSVPYGLLSSTQLRMLASIARRYDKGYAHITTRQNIQYNWPSLESVPDILADLAKVEMHAIQTSGNCIRNFTTDQFAGVAPDEHEDPRPWCEIMRHWATLHPEFAFLPRKFKIAVCGSKEDRAAVLVHDIGLQLIKRDGEVGFAVYVGGGMGRTPVIGSLIREFLPWQHILTYLEAILRVYNLFGNRDNKYKARIKILVKAMGVEAFSERVEQEWAHLKGNDSTLTPEEVVRVKAFFPAMPYRPEAAASTDELAAQRLQNPDFDRWCRRNVREHKQAGYAAVTLSLKETGIPPGDLTAGQFEAIADLADKYSFGEARTTHEQNMVLADVEIGQLYALWLDCVHHRFAAPTVGTLNDMICCPGGDFCSLANAKSIPVAEAIQRRFDDLDYLYDLGDIDLNISGCMNACGHHHVGHIGILGVDKKGEEWFQVQLGGNQGKDAALAKVLGPSFSREEIPDVIGKLLDHYVAKRLEDESFLQTYRRIGHESFKEAAYA